MLEAAEAALLSLRRFGDRRLGLRRPRLPDNHILLIEMKNLGNYRGVAYSRNSPDKPFTIAINKNLRGDYLRETIAHEIFHLIQYAYNETPTSSDGFTRSASAIFTPMVREGGARVAEVIIHPNAQRYEADAHDWFLQGGTSLARYRIGRRRRFAGTSYGAGLFWKYVAEQHASRPPAGVNREIAAWWREIETQRHLLEATARAPSREGILIDVLREARRRMSGLGEFDQFLYVQGDRNFPAFAETTWGNFQVAVLLNGTAGADSRFRFEDAAGWRGVTAHRQVVPDRQKVAFESLPSERPEDAEPFTSVDPQRGVFGPHNLLEGRVDAAIINAEIRLADALHPSADHPLPESGVQAMIPARMLDPFSMMVFQVTMPGPLQTRLLRVEWEPGEGLDDAMVQVVSLDRAAELQDLFRHDGEGRVPLNRTFAFRGVSEVLIVVASRVTAGNFQLTLRRADDAPILSAGDWNAVNSRHLTRDPAVFGVSWQSPDVAFDTSTNPVTLPGVGEITPPGSIYFLVRNRGVVRADGLQVSARRRLLAGNSW
ncbi:MAG: hypothetical protein WCP77_12275, partial [Roseococcus sp.]